MLKIACLAQIVNVIAPILTNAHGLVKQTIFYPIKLFSKYAAGVSLDVLAQSPSYTTREFGDVPLLDVSASYDQAAGRGAVFLVNRSQSDTLPTTVRWQSAAPNRVAAVYQVAGGDPKAANTFEQPDTIGITTLEGMPVADGAVTLNLPPLSFTVLVAEYS
jgi:alpha-N-arabinofuranosidase